VTIDTTDQKTPDVHVGQVLSTSGLQLEQFPAGIPVGRVVSVRHPAQDVEPDIALAPVVDLSALSFVTVLLWSPQSSP
jgi:cell shape-determining protein MreC